MTKKKSRKVYYKQYYQEHKEELLKRGKIYCQLHIEQIKINQTKYRKSHRLQLKQYRKLHKEKIREYNKQYRILHKRESKIYCRTYKQSHRKEFCKYEQKRKQLKCIPLNQWFEGCEGHHIDIERVIYIPHKLHRSIWHNLTLGIGMDVINRLDFDYLKT